MWELTAGMRALFLGRLEVSLRSFSSWGLLFPVAGAWACFFTRPFGSLASRSHNHKWMLASLIVGADGSNSWSARDITWLLDSLLPPLIHLFGPFSTFQLVISHIHHSLPPLSIWVTNTLYCGKKVLTSRISSPDKYWQVVLGVRRGVYGPKVNCCEDYGAFLDWWR
jgi:hypothetical protein